MLRSQRSRPTSHGRVRLSSIMYWSWLIILVICALYKDISHIQDLLWGETEILFLLSWLMSLQWKLSCASVNVLGNLLLLGHWNVGYLCRRFPVRKKSNMYSYARTAWRHLAITQSSHLASSSDLNVNPILGLLLALQCMSQ